MNPAKEEFGHARDVGPGTKPNTVPRTGCEELEIGPRKQEELAVFWRAILSPGSRATQYRPRGWSGW